MSDHASHFAASAWIEAGHSFNITAEEHAMPRDYVPTTDAGKLVFGQNAVNLITPAPTDWGLAALIATALGGHVTS